MAKRKLILATKPITQIDGIVLKRLLLSGFNNLSNSIGYLNDINVFPVSDGDTGTNMKKTFETGVKNIKDSSSFSVVFSSFVDGLLLGSRGNSGLILSQYFAGLFEAIKGKDSVCALEQCDALIKAYESAYEAVLRPVEGTILTVMRDSAVATKGQVTSETTMDRFFDIFTAEVFVSLQKTSSILDILRQNGVVDSGAAGFYLIFDGFRKGLQENCDCEEDDKLEALKQKPTGGESIKDEKLEFRFCTEFSIKLNKPIKKADVVKLIEKRGDSIVVAVKGDFLKVHIHTNEPKEIIALFSDAGEFLATKIDDMLTQKNGYSFAIIGDVTSDLGDELRERFEIDGYIKGHMSIPSGEEIEATLDWAYMPREEFYTDLKANFKKYKTAPASVGEMANYGEQFLKNGKDLLMVSLSSKLSVTYNLMLNAAKILAAKYPSRKIAVVDGKKYSVGTGLLILKACEFRKAGHTIEETAAKLDAIKGNLHQMGTMDDLFFVASKGRISNAKAFFGTMAGIKSLADFDAEGSVTPLGRASGYKKAQKAVVEYIKKTIVDPSSQTIIVAHSAREKQALALVELLKEHIAPKEILLQDIYPATGINAGPGLIAAYYFGTTITDLKFEREAMEMALKAT